MHASKSQMEGEKKGLWHDHIPWRYFIPHPFFLLWLSYGEHRYPLAEKDRKKKKKKTKKKGAMK